MPRVRSQARRRCRRVRRRVPDDAVRTWPTPAAPPALRPPPPPRSRPPAPNAPAPRSPERAAFELAVVGELEAWRVSAIPDPSAPLGAEDVARLVRECFAALEIDPDVGADVSVNTVHYYRRKD